jgi:hypothetical protein
MNKNIWWIVSLVVIVVVAGGWYYSSHEPVKDEDTTKPQVAVEPLASDLTPLYGALSWGSVGAKQEEDLTGVEATSSPITDITNLTEVTQPFEQYYKEKLTKAGWSVDNSRAAGGPGSSFIAYEKGEQHIIIGYTTNFKGGAKDEPVQCPCDITFFVFSGTK